MNTKKAPNTHRHIHRFLCALLLGLNLTIAPQAMAHGKIEIGPNQGRLLNFGAEQPLHAEFVLEGGNFVVSLYDETAKKTIPVSTETLIITHKESGKKITPELKDGKWIVSKPDGEDFWFILQLQTPDGRKNTVARLHFQSDKCGGCAKPEWLCQCNE